MDVSGELHAPATQLAYCLALWPSESLGINNYRHPFFPVHCLLISPISFSTSSSHLNLDLPLLPLPSSSLPNTFLTALPRSILTTCPIHSRIFFLISATTSRSLYSALSSSLVLILHIPCSTTGPHVLLNIFLSHVLYLFISDSVTAHVPLPNTAVGFTTILYTLILTALLLALDLSICLRLQKHQLPAAILHFISLLIKFFKFMKVCKYLKSEPLQGLACSLTDHALNLSYFCSFHILCFACINHQYSAYCSFFNLYHFFNRSHQLSKYQHIICICYILSPCVKIVQFQLGSMFLITYSSTILKSVIGSASPCLKQLSTSNASVNCPQTFTFPFESCNIIFIKLTNVFGILFKISYKYVLLLSHRPV